MSALDRTKRCARLYSCRGVQSVMVCLYTQGRTAGVCSSTQQCALDRTRASVCVKKGTCA
jgi:hypothetical protein